MTIYAFFMTAVVFLIIGMMGHAVFEEWMDSRARKARRKAKARKAAKSANFEPATDRSMDEAVALVQDKLGGEVIAIDTHQV